ncbi:hypothetical protein CW696_07700 [ANME-2 cluster archaeon]|nr:MAG: hypothetical protein CW696_07700 [ANME-2 cluster archaeon]
MADRIPKEVALDKLMKRLDDNPLPLTPELESIVVDEYLSDYAYNEYSAKRLRDWIYKYLPRFFRWYAKQKGLDVLDLRDLDSIRRGDGERFSRSLSDSKSVQTQINATLSAFGRWLLEERYTVYNPFKGIKMKKSRVKSRPPIYNLDELHRIFDAISRISRAPKGMTAYDVKTQYNILARFLLQTGLRYSHALEFRCGDIECRREEVSPLFGYRYCVIPAIEAVEEHKSEVEEELKKKMPPSEIYIDMNLYNDIKEWCERMGLGPRDRIIPASIAAVRDEGRAIKNRAGLPKFSWSIRHTWASVVYAMVGDVGLPTLVKFGGWESASMPLMHYVEVMRPEEAYKIAKEYRIYLPKEYTKRYGEIERDVQILEQPVGADVMEELRTLRQELAELKAAARERE